MQLAARRVGWGRSERGEVPKLDDPLNVGGRIFGPGERAVERLAFKAH